MKWNQGPVIGRGSSATVSLATDVVSGDLFAVKHTELSRSLTLQKEQSLLCRLDPSPYIVQYLGSDITGEGDNLVYNLHIEYLSGGTLHDTILNTVRGFLDDESDIRSYTRGILLGLEHLHANGVAHCDVKSQNVLVAGDGAVKIADLGCAKLVGEGEGSSFSGTPMFMAPEVVRGEEQGAAADVWALGCTVVEMATGRVPWPEERDCVSVMYRVGFSDDVPEIPRWLSEEARDFLEKCLRRDPRERWSVGELLSHPFIAESEEGCRENKAVGFSSWSPNGVLDRVLWESSDESSSSSHMDVDHALVSSLNSARSCHSNNLRPTNSDNVHAHSAYQSLVCYDDGFSKTSDCASERIKKLMMIREFDARSAGWGDNGDWVAVRSNDEEEEEEEEEEEYDDNLSVVMPEIMFPVLPAARIMDLVSEESLYENYVISFFNQEPGLYQDDNSNARYYTFNEYIFGLITIWHF